MKVINRRKGEQEIENHRRNPRRPARNTSAPTGPKYGIEQLAPLRLAPARGAQREDSDIDICLKLRKDHLPHLHRHTRRTATALPAKSRPANPPREHATAVPPKHRTRCKSTSKETLTDMLRFTERQTAFVMDTTEPMSTYHDFLASQSGMVLFNSTCMCLQTIGETIRKVNDRTAGRLLPLPRNPVEANHRHAQHHLPRIPLRRPGTGVRHRPHRTPAPAPHPPPPAGRHQKRTTGRGNEESGGNERMKQ